MFKVECTSQSFEISNKSDTEASYVSIYSKQLPSLDKLIIFFTFTLSNSVVISVITPTFCLYTEIKSTTIKFDDFKNLWAFSLKTTPIIYNTGVYYKNPNKTTRIDF